jgi:cytochrome c peroxidase
MKSVQYRRSVAHASAARAVVPLAMIAGCLLAMAETSAGNSTGNRRDGKHLFERETFAGNGRTCLTCHTRETGTLSPSDAQRRFQANPYDPLFLHDGSDDGKGFGATRIQRDATILVEIALPPNVTLKDDPNSKTVVVRRGIPSTLNSPALDPVLMWDGREANLESQALGAIRGHAQSVMLPAEKDLRRIAEFQRTDAFFTTPALRRYAQGGPPAELPQGRTDSERRGRRFFEDVPLTPGSTAGHCAVCHSGPMLNQTNRFFPAPVPEGSRFQNVLVSEFNAARNTERDFIFRNPDGSTQVVRSADPGRALITGHLSDVNTFKIPSLRGISRTAPYFHDNSAKTLEDVVEHYAKVLLFISDPSAPLILTPQDKADMAAYMRLLE